MIKPQEEEEEEEERMLRRGIIVAVWAANVVSALEAVVVDSCVVRAERTAGK